MERTVGCVPVGFTNFSFSVVVMTTAPLVLFTKIILNIADDFEIRHKLQQNIIEIKYVLTIIGFCIGLMLKRKYYPLSY